MKMRVQMATAGRVSRESRAFTLVEVMVAIAVIGISVGALLTGVSASVLNMRMSRENLRATQIMLERTETLRLLTWDQLNDASFFASGSTQVHYLTDSAGRQYICSHFQQKYDPNSTNAQGLTYSGKIRFYDPRNYSITPAYATDSMKAVWIELTWKTGKIFRSRTLTTLVTRNGMQTYVYGN
jgi:prepilin-type N-terminal cleavage/methylation domain-containing protein